MTTEFDMTGGGQITSKVTDNPQPDGSIGTGGSDSPVSPELNPQPQAGIMGLSEEEERDPNNIVVEISDTSTPIVILFGAKTSGKTMTLIRLTQYLQQQGYQVTPDPIFRPARDTHYQRMCRDFQKMCNNKYAADGNDVMSFMLVKVLDSKGKPICQLLEAPGEHYFDADDPERPFPTYINQFLQLRNKRTWLIIVEKDWGDDSQTRNAYAYRVQNLPPQVRLDKFIFTCHKIDKQKSFLPNGMPNKKALFENIKQQYNGIFTRFVNKNPITRLFVKYRFQFVPFSAGVFTGTTNGAQVYTPSNDMYPRALWKAILKTIKG